MSSVQDLFDKEKIDSIEKFLDHLHNNIFTQEIKIIDYSNLGIIDKDFMEEIRAASENVTILFGKTLRDFKFILTDESLRSHEIFMKYNDPRRLSVSHVNLPHSQLQEREYSTIEEAVLAFQQYINSLSAYFHELECLDRMFTVMEPVNSTFKDNYRRILLDDRIWLHVEVTANGSAINMYLVGQSKKWQDKLQDRLLSWDHDKDIAENIMDMCDVMKTSSLEKPLHISIDAPIEREVEAPSCGICFCVELPNIQGVPQPLCQNANCGVYFHTNCLYQDKLHQQAVKLAHNNYYHVFQWLVACEGGRLPAFGVANGSCPSCFQSITCSEIDN